MSKQFMRFVLIVTTIISGVMFPVSLMADDYQKAVAATNAGNYDQAVALWQKLAKQGNLVAQYNLAIFYKEGYGLDSDSYESKKWYKAAAKQRLISATNRINRYSVKPADERDIPRRKKTQITKNLSDMDPIGWVMNQNPRNYTLQLASTRSESRVKRYFAENQMQGKGGYYKKEQNGETWYFVIYGSYDTAATASSDIEQLPEEIRKGSPWVRRLGNIQKVIRRTGL